MNVIQIKETCVYSHDLLEAKEFYHGLLGLPVISHVEGKHLFLQAGKSVLLIFNPDDSRLKTTPPPHFSTGNLHLAFEVSEADYERVKQELDQKNIPIIDRVVWKSGKESVYFKDPSGNILEIVPDRGIWD